MTRTDVSVLILTAALSMTATSQPSLADAEYAGQAVVNDGDTIEIHGTKIRLWGIDAVEGKQKCWDVNGRLHQCGKYAANALSNFIGRKVVTCNQIDTDRYDRPVAQCFAGGIDIGGWMVAAGFAVDFERYSRGHYADSQAAAQSGSRGNWNFSWQYPANFRSCLQSRGGNVMSCSQQ